MWRHNLSAIAAASVLCAGAPFLGCSSTPTHESTGEYVDDSAITAKVKAAILKDPALKTLQISVTTYKGVVQLSGFVDSKEMVDRAGELAGQASGVRNVKNDLIVK
jgi:osmotically-inducible protein OsmY